MVIRFGCPTCKTSYEVDAEEAGKKCDCQRCGQRMQVPVLAGTRSKSGPDDITTQEAPSRQRTSRSVASPPPIPDSRPVREPRSRSMASVPRRSRVGSGTIIAIMISVFGLFAIGIVGIAWMVRKGMEPEKSIASKPTVPAKKIEVQVPPAPREETSKSVAPKVVSPPERIEPPVQSNQPLSGEQVYQKLVRSSVFIITPTGGSGTGFIVSKEKRLIVTNYHVVGLQKEVEILFPLYDSVGELVTDVQQYRRRAREIAVRGEVIERDVSRDLAMIRVDSMPDRTAAVAYSAKPAPTGSNVFSVGGSGVGENLLWRLTKGTVRGRVQRRQRAEFGQIDCMILETDSPVNPGDSGGPVVNDRGELVAVVSHGLANQRQVSGNIDVEEVKKFIAKQVPLR